MKNDKVTEPVMLWSSSAESFYNPQWTYPSGVPKDVVEVSKAVFDALQAKRVDGFVIRSGSDGKPAAFFDEQAFKVTRKSVEVARLRAYADPVTGSDRFKAEADAERLQGNEEKAVEAEKKLIARRAEIAAENPWPIEG